MPRAGTMSPATGLKALPLFALKHAHVTTWLCTRPQTDNDDYRLAPRTVPDYNFIFAVDGRAVWTIDGVDHALAEGDVVLVPPGVLHHGRSASRRTTLLSIHVLAHLPGGRDLYALLDPPRHRSVAGTRLERILRLAAAEFDRPVPVRMAMMPHWGSLVVRECLLLDAETGRLRARGDDEVVARVLEMLEQRLGRPTRLADLARESGYSPQHLNRRFVASVGTTPLACLAGMRMEHAASLLREGRLSVAAVGERVACPDPAYFSRTFRRAFGRSPSDYQAHASSENPT
jgi:AraC-like DNA-binding protein